jgi:hypothetical protein
VDRIACPWLIMRFIDPGAKFLFVPRDQVLEVAAREDAHSYGAPGAEYTHRDGKCSFDVLVEEFGLTGDLALVRLAQIVHAADITQDPGSSPEGPGLHAIASGFALLYGTRDDHKLHLQTPVYDALYAWCQTQVTRDPSPWVRRPASKNGDPGGLTAQPRCNLGFIRGGVSC